MNKRLQALALGALCIVYAIKGALPAAGWFVAKVF